MFFLYLLGSLQIKINSSSVKGQLSFCIFDILIKYCINNNNKIDIINTDNDTIINLFINVISDSFISFIIGF